MKMRRSLGLVGLLLSLCSCQAMMYGTADQLNDIEVGMSRAEVIARLGEPLTKSATSTEEILTYKWMKAVITWLPQYYFVKIVDNKVHSYGEGKPH
jgi:hypothetical protein